MFFTGCGGKKKGSFTKDELAWMVYEANDTLLYKDNYDQYHQLVIDYRTDLNQIKKYYPIEAEVEIHSPSEDDHFRIYLIKDEYSFKIFLRMAEVYRPFDLVEPLNTLTINGKTYKDVYVFEENPKDIDSCVWKVYFNKKYGILRYVKKEEWIHDLVINSDKTEMTNRK